MANYSKLIGSVSSGTMRPEDLIPAFLDTLCYAGIPQAKLDSLSYDWEACCDEDGEIMEDKQGDADNLLDALFELLSESAPPHFYFGSHPGDGADYGFWLSDTLAEDFDGLRVSDTSEVPDDYTGEVLHVNDHGNCKLYSANGGKLTKVWAVV